MVIKVSTLLFSAFFVPLFESQSSDDFIGAFWCFLFGDFGDARECGSCFFDVGSDYVVYFADEAWDYAAPCGGCGDYRAGDRPRTSEATRISDVFCSGFCAGCRLDGTIGEGRSGFCCEAESALACAVFRRDYDWVCSGERCDSTFCASSFWRDDIMVDCSQSSRYAADGFCHHALWCAGTSDDAFWS